MSITTTPPQDNTAGRDHNGKFTKGNPGGPGNPFAGQVARLKKMLLERITDEDIDAIADKLIELAKEGSLPAIKLLLAYALGKPGQTFQPHPVQALLPDQFLPEADGNSESHRGATTPVPDLAPDLTPLVGPSLLDELARQLRDSARADEQRPLSRQQRRAERRERERAERRRRQADANGRQARNAVDSAPLPNGIFNEGETNPPGSASVVNLRVAGPQAPAASAPTPPRDETDVTGPAADNKR
jgi:hypothetical protein